jgi:hypothetical protein
MKRTLVTASLMAAGLFSLPRFAANIEVSVTNLTHGNHFTPILIAAHDAGICSITKNARSRFKNTT